MARLVALVAIAIAVGCSNRASKPVIEDAAIGDGGVDPIELAGGYDRKCVTGDLDACRNLGVMYAEGIGISRDLQRAAKLFVQSCNGGNLPACSHLALAYLEGTGIERQPAKAAEIYQKACDGGYKLACRNLGLMLRDGAGMPPDLARAAALLDKACKGGVPFACTNAGDVDAARAIKGGPARYKEMIGHYKQGCDAGDPTSCRQLGIAYLEGKGLPKSTTAAAVWLERACMPDDPVGCRLLGQMRLQGLGVARDVDRGRQLLGRACDAKDDLACRLLKSAPESAPLSAPLTGSPPEDAGVGGSGAGTWPVSDAKISGPP